MKQGIRSSFPGITPAVLAVCGFFGSGLVCPPAHGRDLQWVRPRIGQRGTTVEVVLQGKFLAEPRELVFYKPGIRCETVELLPPLEQPRSLAHGGRLEDQVKAVLEIAPGCEPGEHPFRLLMANGLSVLNTFHVSPFPVVAETTGENDTIATAQPVEQNVTILGNVDTDVFKVPAVPGSRLSVEVDCVRLADVHHGAAEFDLAVRILDETGRELAANDDSPLHVQDPLMSVKIPDELPGGHVYVEVSQSVHSPGDAPYCVHIGTFRRPLAAFPPGGPAGSSLDVTFLGDPLGEFKEMIAVPATPGTFSWFGDAPSALALRSSPYPNLLEDRAAVETRVPSLPIAINGVLDRVGETDVFRLSVSKGDRYRVRVYASALGLPVDPAIRIRKAGPDGETGTVEVEADDAASQSGGGSERDLFGTCIRAGGGFQDVFDPTVIWEPKADGEYLLEVRDVSGGGGPAEVYRIEIDSPPQTLHFVAQSQEFNTWPELPRQTGLAVPQGGRWTVTLDVRKAQGTTYSGPFDIVAHGLPDGVRLVSPQFPKAPPVNRHNVARWPIQFIADGDAKPTSSLIALEARAADPTVVLETHCQQAVPFVNDSGGDAGRILRVDRFALAVTEPAPITVDLVQPTIPVVRGGELAIAVKLSRRAGFDDPVEFQADFGPDGVGLPPKDVIPSGDTEAILRISADRNAPLGKGPLYVMATTVNEARHTSGFGRIRVASQFVEIEVGEPFVELVSEPASVRRGERATFAFAVTPKTPFEGEAEARLLGLPKGVRVAGDATKVTKNSKQIVFEIEATDEALLGPVSGLECELIVNAAGQEIRQRSGKGTLRIDPRL
jgi:hypothetical protein